MNARQAAKKWKRAYMEMMARPIKVRTLTKQFDTLKVMRMYPKIFVTTASEDYIRETVKKDLAFGIAERMGKYVNYYTEYDVHSDNYRFVASIDVVRKENTND